MKVRITIMTENDKHLDESTSTEYAETQARMGWQMIMNMLAKESNMEVGDNTRAVVELCEIVER